MDVVAIAIMTLSLWTLKAILYQRAVRSFKHSAQVHQEQTDLLQLHTNTYTSVCTNTSAHRRRNTPSSQIYRATE